MNGIIKTGESLLFSVGVLLLLLVALYGLASLVLKFSPQPLSGWINNVIAHTTPAGWGIGTSNS